MKLFEIDQAHVKYLCHNFNCIMPKKKEITKNIIQLAIHKITKPRSPLGVWYRARLIWQNNVQPMKACVYLGIYTKYGSSDVTDRIPEIEF